MQAKAVAGGLLAVIVGGAAFFFWPNEASRVRARVIAAADAVSAHPGEGDIDRLARLAGLAKTLSPDIVVEAEPGGPAIRGREAVAALATQLSTAGGPQRIELSDLDVAIDEGAAHAVVTAVAHVTSTGAGGGTAAGFDGNVIRIELARTDEGWLITRASPTPALAR
jgi:ketosteroid isomerase-like protein